MMNEEVREPGEAIRVGEEEEEAICVPLVASSGLPMLLWLFAVLPSVLLAFGAQRVGLPPGLGSVVGIISVVLSTAAAGWVTLRLYGWSVVVGADGVLVGSRVSSRLIRYEQIVVVVHTPGRVLLELAGGEVVKLVTWDRSGQRGSTDESPAGLDRVGEVLARTIERRRESRAERGHSAGVHEAAVARGGRSALAWLEALRRLAAGTADAYRAVIVDREQLWALLNDPSARPAARAAAAVALGSAEENRTRERLRIAAAAMADPETRGALYRIAEATDDAALAEALAVLQDEDPRGASTRKRRG